MGKAGSRGNSVCSYGRVVRNQQRLYPSKVPESKYRNHRVNFDGMTFDSKKEFLRYRELKLLEKNRMITGLERQVSFELIPKQVENGRVVERAVKYIADFTYYENGKLVVEDVKSPATRTDVYKIKRKLMLHKLGIRIREI